MSESKPPVTTNDSGIPAPSDEFSLTVGPAGPTVLHDHYTVQKMQHFNRERVPERVVHAKGTGAHGFFEVTHDVTWFTRANFLGAIGKRTPMFARFSTVAGEQGFPDTVRDPRGFALKFYTDEGNYDLVGNNTPVFFVRDAIKFQDFIHSQKRLPDTGMRSNDMQWDFWTLSPESAHQVTVLMSDRGTPHTLRNMNGYGSHTFSTVNAGGERFWVKFHFKTAQGIENFTGAEAKAMTAEDPDFHRRDLREAIAAGRAPEWHLEMQIMPFADAATYRFNPFDLTKVWPHQDYPPVQVGRMVLDRNPENFFAEVEQSSFSPANLVPGIG
ncbi:MAG TPA: catalase, partial [Candidatus Dormibacteraeota bacterium]|nr:catalase [Candidatus Dormibacteraeota bacterium]